MAIHHRMEATDEQVVLHGRAWRGAAGTVTSDAGSMAGAIGEPYDHLEHEGAYFRRDRSRGRAAVDDVLHGGRWVPYRGDRHARLLRLPVR